MDRSGFQPLESLGGQNTWGDAPGWYRAGLWPLKTLGEAA